METDTKWFLIVIGLLLGHFLVMIALSGILVMPNPGLFIVSIAGFIIYPIVGYIFYNRENPVRTLFLNCPKCGQRISTEVEKKLG